MRVLDIIAAGLILGVAATGFTLSTRAEEGSFGMRVGTLSCRPTGEGFTYLLHSRWKVNCVFHAAGGGEERYTGISGIGLGLDAKWSNAEEIHFAVLAGTSSVEIGTHPLAGTYAGPKASVAFAVGPGAALLVGGGSRNVTLAPLGIEGIGGFGIAAGLSYLILEPAGQ